MVLLFVVSETVCHGCSAHFLTAQQVYLQVQNTAQPINRFADIIGRYWPSANLSVSVYMFFDKCRY